MPALAFFLGTVIWCLRTQLRLLRELGDRDDALNLRNLVFCLSVSFVGYMIICVFSSIAYQVYLPTFAALTVVFRRRANEKSSVVAAVRNPGSLLARQPGASGSARFR